MKYIELAKCRFLKAVQQDHVLYTIFTSIYLVALILNWIPFET